MRYMKNHILIFGVSDGKVEMGCRVDVPSMFPPTILKRKVPPVQFCTSFLGILTKVLDVVVVVAITSVFRKWEEVRREKGNTTRYLEVLTNSMLLGREKDNISPPTIRMEPLYITGDSRTPEEGRVYKYIYRRGICKII